MELSKQEMELFLHLQKTSFTKCFSFHPRGSKLICKTENRIIQTGNRIIQIGNRIIQTGNGIIQIGNGIVQTGNGIIPPSSRHLIKWKYPNRK